MWKKITNSRWYYILISLLLAFILWLYVGNEVNPVSTGSLRNLPVHFIGLEKLEERGLMISEGEKQTISIWLSARRDVLGKLNDENVTIIVDVSSISKPGDYRLDSRIGLPLSVNQDSVDVRDKRPEKISISVSQRASKQVEVRGEFTGSVAEGFQMENFSFAPATVTVSGRQELVDQVDYVLVSVSQEDLDETFSKDVPFKLIDFSGNVITASDSELETDVNTILATLPIVQLKKVSLKVELEPGGGATEKDVDVTIRPPHIVVSGSEDDLDGLNELSLGKISLRGIFGEGTFSVPIQLAPEFTNVSGEKEATVTIRIKGLQTKVLEVDNIELINCPAPYHAERVTQSCDITVRGPEKVINEITESQVRIVADLKGIARATGNQTVPVKVYLNGDSEAGIVGDYTIVVAIKR